MKCGQICDCRLPPDTRHRLEVLCWRSIIVRQQDGMQEESLVAAIRVTDAVLLNVTAINMCQKLFMPRPFQYPCRALA